MPDVETRERLTIHESTEPFPVKFIEVYETPDKPKSQTVTEPGAPAEATRLLVCCPSPELRLYIQKALAVADLESRTLTSLQEARDYLGEDSAFGGILVELEDPLPEGQIKVLKRFCSDFRHLPVMVIAPGPSPELVRDAMRCGVVDFLTNPFATTELAESVREALCQPPTVEAAREKGDAPGSSTPTAGNGSPSRPVPREEPAVTSRPDPVDEPVGSTIITRNPAMGRVLEVVSTVAPTDSTVLIEGESGTGKELVAKRIHRESRRSEGPFIEVHCGAIPPNLLESELFGHERGSFTGAVSRQVGLFEVANRGTIFLDEIAEMNLDMQVKLLRVLQERTFRRIGGQTNLQTDVRVVAATNRDLKGEVEARRFRADLYYRLNVISLKVPPLGERLEDIPHLVEFFAERFFREKGLPEKRFDVNSLARLQRLRWVGNVRELENVVERLLLLSRGDVVLPEDIDSNLEVTPHVAPEVAAGLDPSLTLDEVKSLHIVNVLKANNGNKMKSARILGINIKTLYNLIQRLKIPID